MLHCEKNVSNLLKLLDLIKNYRIARDCWKIVMKCKLNKFMKFLVLVQLYFNFIIVVHKWPNYFVWLFIKFVRILLCSIDAKSLSRVNVSVSSSTETFVLLIPAAAVWLFRNDPNFYDVQLPLPNESEPCCKERIKNKIKPKQKRALING